MAVVFHAATAAPSVQNAQTEALMMAVNVEGTQHVVQACQRQRVPKLIYLSSASVVWDGRDLIDVDETIPYARRNPDFYAKTKVRCRLLVHPIAIISVPFKVQHLPLEGTAAPSVLSLLVVPHALL